MQKLIKNIKSKECPKSSSNSLQNFNDNKYRKYACEDISNNLTHIIVPKDNFFVVDLPKGSDFHFIGRVDTNRLECYESNSYYKSFEVRNFISFSIINKKNISHYKGDVFFVYDVIAEDIVHIFPMDSDTKKYAETEEDLASVPSLWLSLEELENVSTELGVYNQVTCKTKRNGQILKPFAIVAFNELDERTKKIAEQFKIGCIIVHPDEDAINYDKDLLYDCATLNSISTRMEELFKLPVRHLLYLD